MKFFLLFCLSFLFVSCTSLQNKNLLKKFNEAKVLSQKGEVRAAQEIFKKLCAEKHNTSCLLSGEKVNWYAGYAVMQASTDEKSANFVILQRKTEAPQIFAYNPETKMIMEAQQRTVYSRIFSEWITVHLKFKDLKPQQSYQLVIMANGGELVDFRSFNTLETKKENLKWALTSCMSDHYETEQKQQWKELSSFESDVLFMIGDNVYVDWNHKRATGQTLWKRYVETRNKLEIFRRQKLTPVFATWDDHDYGDNNGDRTFLYKDEAKKVFSQFFPMNLNHVVLSHGPGVASSVRLSDQLFIFFDDRSFRTPEKEKEESHFGNEQVSWALSEIKKNKLPTWLISGDQFFGGYHPFESFEGSHPNDFKKFLEELKKTGEKILFLSGDRHLSEIMSIKPEYLGFKTFEITSSGIHSTTYPDALEKNPNPRSLVGVDGIINYMIIESRNKKNGIQAIVKDFGPGKNLLFEKQISVQ